MKKETFFFLIYSIFLLLSFSIHAQNANFTSPLGNIPPQDNPFAPRSASPQSNQPSNNTEYLQPNQINRSHVGKIVRVQGFVQKFEPSWEDRQPNCVYLQDATGGVLRVVYWKPVADALGVERTPQPGQLLRIRGQVNQFQNTVNVMVTNPTDIVDVGAIVVDDVPSIALSAITRDQLNKTIKIMGKVTDIKPSWKPTAPDIITLSHGTNSIKVVYWSDVKNNLKPEQLPEVGKVLFVEGFVDEYRNELQVKVDSPHKISPMKTPKAANNPSAVSQANTSLPSPQTNNPVSPPATIASSSKPTVFTPASGASTKKGPGFYSIENAIALIKGPPTRAHVLYFSSEEDFSLSQDPKFLELSKQAVFVWIDIHESAHIADQLGVSGDPTWIFYDSGGLEQARVTGRLTSSQISQYIALILK